MSLSSTPSKQKRPDTGEPCTVFGRRLRFRASSLITYLGLVWYRIEFGFKCAFKCTVYTSDYIGDISEKVTKFIVPFDVIIYFQTYFCLEMTIFVSL